MLGILREKEKAGSPNRPEVPSPNSVFALLTKESFQKAINDGAKMSPLDHSLLVLGKNRLYTQPYTTGWETNGRIVGFEKIRQEKQKEILAGKPVIAILVFRELKPDEITIPHLEDLEGLLRIIDSSNFKNTVLIVAGKKSPDDIDFVLIQHKNNHNLSSTRMTDEARRAARILAKKKTPDEVVSVLGDHKFTAAYFKLSEILAVRELREKLRKFN